ncbi:MAG: TRAP transporter substrate-binding protein [Deltaproteobacteria bacterium]|nr:TRAP transporter substrate-binding protein [Deltaproteobacteria bacterium]
MLRSLLLVLVAIVVVSFLPACAGPPEEVYEIRISSQMPIGHPISESVDLFCERAEEESNGRLVFHHFPAGQLLKDVEVPEAISTGTIEMAQTYFPWWSGVIPGIMPYGGKSYEDLDHYLRLSRGPLGEYQAELMEEQGNAKVIAPILYCASAGYILTRPVHSPGDMEGIKVRISSKAIAAEVTALGGAPVVMSSADVYMALQQATIDGAHSGITSFYARKWYEVAKYVFIPRFIVTDFYIVANLDWWNSLPSDLQQIMMDVGEEATEYCTQLVLAQEEEARQGLRAEGVEIYEVSPDEYEAVFAPILEPALRAAAVEDFGEELVAQYEAWVEETR